MQLSHELPDYAFTLRSADGRHARVNDLTLTDSFILSPQQLVENWPVRDSAALTADDLAPLLALQPEVILLGTGERQVFPPASVMAACLRQGVGLEVMTNAAAARTFFSTSQTAALTFAAVTFCRPSKSRNPKYLCPSGKSWSKVCTAPSFGSRSPETQSNPAPSRGLAGPGHA